ncbi:hypothetical protein KAR91_31835 [Candidatus Pacearchaeota archaeon]|nr:hypothetical protein [Candidatus Pacearchaeota archaeon]
MIRLLSVALLVFCLSFDADAFMLIGGRPPVAAATCQGGTYMFAYNGDYPADTDKACFTSGGANKDGTVNGATVTSSYVLIEGGNQYIKWAVSGEDGISDTEGTVYMNLYIIDDGNADVDSGSFYEAWVDASNYMYCQMDDGTDKVACYHAGQADSNLAFSGVTLSLATEYRIGFAWKVGEAGNDLAVSVVSVGSAPSWTEYDRDNTAFAGGSQPDSIALGEDQSTWNPVDDFRVSDVTILSTFEATDPLEP